jgi:DNA-binding transcriptional LysR family regulator
MEKYMVSLAPQERVELQQLVTAGKAAARRLTHARVLLLADRDERPDDEIVAALGVSLRTVERVRKRLVTKGLDAAIDPRPQPPRPDKIKIRGDLEQKLVELACADPPPGRCRWTLRLLADEMVVLGLVDAVSAETVRHALKKMTSTHGSSKDGASRPTLTPSSSGAWRM